MKWTLGRHKLVQGDAFDPDDLNELIGNTQPAIMINDPPYGISLDTSGMKKPEAELSLRSETKSYREMVGDDQIFNPRDIILMLPEIKEQFWWGADYYIDNIPYSHRGSWLVWDKRVDENLDKMFGSAFELCLSRVKHKREIIRIRWGGPFGTEREPDKSKKRVHPSQKPVLLAEWLIEKYTHPNEVVLDLFGGSGSTLLACERLNRRCLIMEIDKEYCDTIIRRYREMVGEE